MTSKKFIPYKRILAGSDSSSLNDESRKQMLPESQDKVSIDSLVVESEVTKKQDLSSGLNETTQVAKQLKMSKKCKKHKRTKITVKEQSFSNVLIEESSTSGDDKNNKENNTGDDDIIHVEDSNDADDCVVVLDGNGNNVKSLCKSPIISCHKERKECSSPAKLNSTPLVSTQVFNFSQKGPILSETISKRCSARIKHKKKSQREILKQNAWEKLFDNVNVLLDDKQKKMKANTKSKSKSTHMATLPLCQEPNTSSAQFVDLVECSTASCSSKTSTNIGESNSSSSSQSDLTSHSNKSPNSTNSSNKLTCMNQTQASKRSSPSQSNCNGKNDENCALLEKRRKTECPTKEDGPNVTLNNSEWITLDETTASKLDETTASKLDETITSKPDVFEIQQLDSSDVLIIDSTLCESRSQGSMLCPSANESVIIDLEMITPAGSKPPIPSNDGAPLIVFDACTQNKPSTSSAPWSNSESYGICPLPDMIPLNSKWKSHKSNKKQTKYKKKKDKGRKKGKRLSQIEADKLNAIRNTNYPSNQASGSGTIWNNCPYETPMSTNTFSNVLKKGLSNVVFPKPNSNPVGISNMPANSLGNQVCFLNTLPQGGQPRQVMSNVPKPQREDTNIYNPAGDGSKEKKSGLRPIVIDGCNVAVEHGRVSDPMSQFNFSAKGVQIMVDYFRKRGHKEIHVFVPHHKAHRGPSNTEIFEQLKNEGILTLTPSRYVEGRLQAAYDDRYIVQTATELGGVIVSNDRYRDLMQENDKWKATIEQRLLMFNFVKDLLMFPQDPLGRLGPTLDQFLKFPE
ncbi:hypothetical protein WDU94_005991 [Cyamophila willieti]